MTSQPESAVRRLGLTTLVCLVVANMIGSGVFTTSGFAVQALGTPERVLLAWLVGGVVALLGALSYGALAARLSESGGEYLFLSRTIHPVAGFVAGWVSLWAGFTGAIALAAAVMQEYLRPWLAGDGGMAVDWIGTVAIVAAGIQHSVSRTHGAIIHNSVVGLKLVLLAVFFFLGLSSMPRLEAAGSEQVVAFSVPVFAVQLMWVSLSYSGWNAAIYVGGEVRDPKRNLPRSMWLGTLLVMAIYLLLNAVFVYSAPVGELAGRKDVAAVAAQALGGDGLANLVRAIICVALFTSISGMVLTGPRVYARMAKDGVFPRVFGRGDEVPASAVWLQVALAVGVLWVSGLRELLGYLGFTLSLSTAAAVVGLFLLRRREGAERVPVPGYPWVPGAFVVLVLATGTLMLFERSYEPVMGLVTVATGLLVYAILRSQTPVGQIRA